MEYTQTIDPTDFWSWKKIDAGHYVLTTDTRYEATVRSQRDMDLPVDHAGWYAFASSPSGRVFGQHDFDTMADARKWALSRIDRLVQLDETELVTNSLRSGTSRRTSGVTMPYDFDEDASASFTVEGDHHTYKVTVERWNG